MTITEIQAKIVEWITTGIPLNVKSFNLRTLLSQMAIRMDVQEVGRLKITKAQGNTGDNLEIGDNVYGYIEGQLIYDAIYLGGNVNLLSSYLVLNGTGIGAPTILNEYTNIANMLADQASQTQGSLQFVEDASADPDVAFGDATYVYLGNNTGSLNDYRRLTDSEITTLNNSQAYRTFTVEAVLDSAPVFPQESKISFEYNNADDYVTAIYFNEEFSKYLQRLNDLKTTFNYTLFFYNKSKTTVQITQVTDLQFTGANCKATVSNTINRNTLSLGDTLELNIPAYILGSTNVPDGNKGDITVTANGITWTINNGVITAAKLHPDVISEINGAYEQDNMTEPTTTVTTLEVGDHVIMHNTVDDEWVMISRDDLLTYFGGIYVAITNFLQEKLSGTTISATSVSGTYNVDWNAGSVWDINCNGNTTLADTNLPISSTNKVINIYMDFDNGTEVVTLPGYWIKDADSDDLDATQRVRLTVEAINNTSDVTYYVKNLG